MVRTYAVNALTQSNDNIFNNNTNNPRRGTWNGSQEQEWNYDQGGRQQRYQAAPPPEDPGPHQYQNRGHADGLPPIGMAPIASQFQQHHMPNYIHSPFVDPVGTIVGLRLVYSEGKICYVPVEPHINLLINQQFGSQSGTPPLQNIYQMPNNFINQSAGPPLLPFQQPYQQPTRYQEPVQELPPAGRQQYQQQSQQYFPTQQDGAQQRPSNRDMGNLPNRIETPQTLPPANNSVMPSHNTRRRSDEMNDFWFPNNPQPRSGIRRSKEWRNETVDAEYNPWGRGGGGSPLKDSMGNLITDRRVMGRAWNKMLSTNLPHSLERRSAPNSLSNTYSSSTSSYGDWSNSRMPSFAPMSVSTSMPNLNKGLLSDADQHRAELQKQIDDNRRRKEIEKQKEKEQEDKEMRRHDEYMAKVKREEEEERRKQKERAMAAERRSQQIAYEQQEKARQTRRQRSPPPQEYAQQRQSRPDSAAPRGQEWWEKKPTWQQKQDDERKSAVIPTLRGKPPRTPSAQRSVSRHSVQPYDPTSSIQEHEAEQREAQERESSARSRRGLSRRSTSNNMDLNDSFRRMDVTEENLRGEQQRVHDAIRNNDYGNGVFNDTTGRPTAFVIN